jgi:hypothetical protein
VIFILFQTEMATGRALRTIILRSAQTPLPPVKAVKEK